MKTSLFYLMDHYPELSGPMQDRYAAVIDQAVLAESIGYESVWLAEHHFHQLGTVPNPAVMLAAIAARTIVNMGGPEFVPDELFDKLVDAGTGVLGDPAQAAALMQGFAEQGVEHMAFLNAYGALPIDANARSIELLAKAASHVTPNLAARDTAPASAAPSPIAHHAHH